MFYMFTIQLCHNIIEIDIDIIAVNIVIIVE